MPDAPKRKPWRYENALAWAGEKRGVLSAAGKPDLPVATPPDFGGHDGIWSPEDLFVASVNACIMTTFLYYRAKLGIELVDYRSEAEGEVVYEEHKLHFTEVTVRPEVVVASEADRTKAEDALGRAEQACLITNSARCAVHVAPTVRVAPGGGDERAGPPA